MNCIHTGCQAPAQWWGEYNASLCYEHMRALQGINSGNSVMRDEATVREGIQAILKTSDELVRQELQRLQNYVQARLRQIDEANRQSLNQLDIIRRNSDKYSSKLEALLKEGPAAVQRDGFLQEFAKVEHGFITVDGGIAFRPLGQLTQCDGLG